MSLHIEPSIVVKRRVRWQRVMAAAMGVVVAVLIVAGSGLLMDEVRLRGIPKYQPQFVGFTLPELGGCGGLRGCQIGIPVLRKPTAPSSGVRPLGLAPHAPVDRLFMTVEEWDTAVPVVDFGDDERW